MEQDKLRAKLEKMTKDLRRQAVEMEEALSIARNLTDEDITAQIAIIEDTEEKLRYYKQMLARMVNKRWADKQMRRGSPLRKAPEDRVFAEPSKDEGGEATIPSIEERILVLNGKTRKETFESGTLIEKMRAFLCFQDDKNYLGGEITLTDEELDSLKHSVFEEGGTNITAGYMREFDRLCSFGEQLSYYFKRFQTAFANLANLLNLWDCYDGLAIQQTKQVRALIETEESDSGGQQHGTISNLIDVVEATKLHGTTLLWDEKRNSFEADVYREGGLYERILQEAKETEAAMSDFNALAFAAEDYINRSELHYTPISIQLAIENAKTERYTRYLVKNLIYFRSEYLRKRKETGSPLTLGEKRRALIPDYYETKPNRELYRDARAILK